MTKIELSVTGMTCQGCSNSLIRLFGELPGTSDIQVSHESGMASVEIDPAQVNRAQLVEVVNRAGFSVT